MPAIRDTGFMSGLCRVCVEAVTHSVGIQFRSRIPVSGIMAGEKIRNFKLIFLFCGGYTKYFLIFAEQNTPFSILQRGV